MGHHQRYVFRGNSERQETLLSLRMIRIIKGERKRITENGGCFIEANAMFDLVGFRFVGIPFEPHHDTPIPLTNDVFVDPVEVAAHDLFDLILGIPALHEAVPDDPHAMGTVHRRHVERPVGSAELRALFFEEHP